MMLFYGLVEAGASRLEPQPTRHTDALYPYLATTQASVDQKVWTGFVEKLSRKQSISKSETQFLRVLFNQTHKKFLKRYAANTTFASLFDSGTFNCLTGTILYSILLNHFQIEHEVIETNYHIFIVAQTQEGKILMEVTDPLTGFVTSSDKIEARIAQYRQQGVQPLNPALSYYDYSFELYNEVSQHELIGLLYYNLAVESFNQANWQQAVNYLGQAIERYASPRIEEFSELLLLAVHESDLKDQDKILYKKKLQTIRYKAMFVMAGQ
ncbi:MAG: hypothetical protein KIT51_00220 [Cyclobacteriaceae bacterium]|nr:MAG: hypothetical protein KIT51_00220 [Cyclobacteriaceae bacterium]